MSGDAHHDSDEQPTAGEAGETLAPDAGAEGWSESDLATLWHGKGFRFVRR